MKHYQDHDPLHGNGKAVPHPPRATQFGSRRPFRHHHTPKKVNGITRCKSCRNVIQLVEDNWIVVK